MYAHVKDPEQLEYKLTRPIPGRVLEVTEDDLEADADSFVTFASAFGVAPGGRGRIERPSTEAEGA